MEESFINLLALVFKPLFTIASLEWNIGGIKFSIIQLVIFCFFVGLIIKLIKGIGNTGGGK